MSRITLDHVLEGIGTPLSNEIHHEYLFMGSRNNLSELVRYFKHFRLECNVIEKDDVGGEFKMSLLAPDLDMLNEVGVDIDDLMNDKAADFDIEYGGGYDNPLSKRHKEEHWQLGV